MKTLVAAATTCITGAGAWARQESAAGLSPARSAVLDRV